MIILYILLGILLLIGLILLTKLTFIIKADEDFKLYLRILFIKIRLFPSKEKKIRLSDYKIKRFRKGRLKEEKKLRAEQKKKARKEDKKGSESKDQKEEEEKVPLRDRLEYYVEILKNVVFASIRELVKYWRIDIKKISITVSSEDAAKTAITYGYVYQAVLYIKEILENCIHVKYSGDREEHITVDVDWLEGKSSLKADLSISIRAWQILSVGGFTALKNLMSIDKPKPPLVNANDADKAGITATENDSNQ